MYAGCIVDLGTGEWRLGATQKIVTRKCLC